jgi:hypothetical protein
VGIQQQEGQQTDARQLPPSCASVNLPDYNWLMLKYFYTTRVGSVSKK